MLKFSVKIWELKSGELNACRRILDKCMYIEGKVISLNIPTVNGFIIIMLKFSINIWELKSGNSAHEHMGIDKL